MVKNLTSVSRADSELIVSAEEITNASSVVPWSMITTVLLNGFLGPGMLIAILFVMGDVDEALESTFFFPFVTIFQSITKSTPAAIGVVCRFPHPQEITKNSDGLRRPAYYFS